jgi:hypothetical protein
MIRINARNKKLAVLLDHLSDPQDFDDIDASSDDGHS